MLNNLGKKLFENIEKRKMDDFISKVRKGDQFTQDDVSKLSTQYK